MLHIFLMFLIILLAVLGLSFLIESIWLYLLTPKNSPKRDVIIELREDIAIMQIEAILEEQKWNGSNKINRIFATTNNISEVTLLKCEEKYKNKVLFLSKFMEN